MGRLAPGDTPRPSCLPDRTERLQALWPEERQPGSLGHQGGRESFEALELQKPLIFWRPDRHNMGPAETQGPHERGLVPPDLLGLVAMTRAPANTPRWQGAQYAHTEAQLAGKGGGKGAGKGAGEGVGKGARGGGGDRRASLSLEHRQQESRDTANRAR